MVAHAALAKVEQSSENTLSQGPYICQLFPKGVQAFLRWGHVVNSVSVGRITDSYFSGLCVLGAANSVFLQELVYAPKDVFGTVAIDDPVSITLDEG